MLLLRGCRASDAHYGEERPPWPPTAPRAGLGLPRRFQSERGVCKDADSSQETLSVRTASRAPPRT